MEGEKRAADRGIAVWLAGLNPGVLEVVRHAGLDQRLGRERMLFNAREAIERYQALVAAPGGTPQPTAVVMRVDAQVLSAATESPWLKSPPAGNGVPSVSASARPKRSWRSCKPRGTQDSDEIYLLAPAGGQRQDPRCADGHQAAARGQRRRPGAVDAGDEGRLSAACCRSGQGARGPRAAACRPRCARATRSTSSWPSLPRRAAPCARSRCTSGARATPSAAAWPSCPRWWPTASPRARSRSSRRMPPR